MSDGMAMQVTTKVSDDGKTITGIPMGSFMAGTYKVTWHAAAVDDGHRTEGAFTFLVK
jgi:methionine-rich copper-binding protein CopC